MVLLSSTAWVVIGEELCYKQALSTKLFIMHGNPPVRKIRKDDEKPSNKLEHL